MDVFTKKREAMWDMVNPVYRSVTVTEWTAWLSKAFEEETQHLEVLKKRLITAIQVITTDNPGLPSAEDAEGERNRRRAVVAAVLQDKLGATEVEGLTADFLQKLRLLLVKHCDVFRLDIDHDEPIKVEPLRVRIKPDAVPVKCDLR
ncbi:hypothetical protein DYB26_010448 [Aphanomyces astaci]|uniref:Uncharacterized protein n=1 Tax=Aphanomyces astaci TaxID=112090 RepID=A0A418FKP9_APHAT|nr:hypothetical protein DYB26_010448 [Aphanomyces astaci]